MYSVKFSQLIKYQFKTISFSRKLELPFPPIPGMYFNEDEWECRVHEVTWDVSRNRFHVYNETIQAQSEDDRDELLRIYGAPESLWTRAL